MVERPFQTGFFFLPNTSPGLGVLGTLQRRTGPMREGFEKQPHCGERGTCETRRIADDGCPNGDSLPPWQGPGRKKTRKIQVAWLREEFGVGNA